MTIPGLFPLQAAAPKVVLVDLVEARARPQRAEKQA
jgi:hypothetical protein